MTIKSSDFELNPSGNIGLSLEFFNKTSVNEEA